MLPRDVYTKAVGYGFEPGATIHQLPHGCTSDTPFFFSVALPEGNYRIRATFAPAETPGIVSIKAELRRLMVHDLALSDSKPTTCEFSVNTRTPSIADSARVSLKPREKTSEIWAWDEKLTLEFNGTRPCLATLEIKSEPDAITVFLAGDSTVTDQPLEPWNSWGQMLPVFFQPGVTVSNHAESGETLRNSLAAKRFAKIFSLIKPGDYVFIQFGHNDMKDKSPNALEKYRENLVKVVGEIRAHEAHPVLVTSMERKDGLKKPTLMAYPQTVRDVAAELEVPLVDLNAMSLALYKALGADLNKAFQDGTHHTNFGSYLFAECVIQSIRDLKLDLAKYIRDDFTGFDPQHPDPFETVHIPASPHFDLTKPAGS